MRELGALCTALRAVTDELLQKAAILPIPLMGAFGFVTSAIMAAAYDHGRGVMCASLASPLIEYGPKF